MLPLPRAGAIVKLNEGSARRRLALAGALLIAVAAALALWSYGVRGAGRTGPTGLFTTLPILWAESADVASLVKGDAPPHWARAALAERGALVAFDNLSRLDGIRVLVMAQPRPLSPQENVALDDWVRGGGRLLLLADPMLTAHSGFAIGDRRRPQDVVLISPLLTHWGLRLEFDDVQPLGPRDVQALGATFPVNLPGRLTLTAQTAAYCVLGGTGSDGGIAADCRIDKGRAIIVADAALLETDEPPLAAARKAALDALIDRLVGTD